MTSPASRRSPTLATVALPGLLAAGGPTLLLLGHFAVRWAVAAVVVMGVGAWWMLGRRLRI